MIFMTCCRLMRWCLLIVALLAAPAAWGQSNRAERFDTSGMPRRPTTFVEQQILEMIATHMWGDLTDAARIQRKLGRYYADKGDEKRATAAFLAAAAAERASGSNPEAGVSTDAEKQRATPPAPSALERATPSSDRPGPAFTGNYFGYDGRTLHTWEFRADGTFLHSWIVSGPGTSVRNSERGVFRVSGDVLELGIASAASGFVTPGVGGRSTVAGGGAEERGEVRRVKFAKSVDGVVLDGVKLKPKNW